MRLLNNYPQILRFQKQIRFLNVIGKFLSLSFEGRYSFLRVAFFVFFLLTPLFSQNFGQSNSKLVGVTREIHLMGTQCRIDTYAHDRQSGILQLETLLEILEAEESQRERGEEEKRESIEWNYEIKNNSSEYLEYIQKKKEQEELLKTTPIQLNPFYKQKVNEYFNNLTDE